MYSLNIYAIPLFVTALLIFLLGFFVFIRNPNSTVNRSFALVCLGIVVWQFMTGIEYLSDTKELALFWARLSYLGIVFITPGIYHFTISYLNLHKQFKIPKILYFLSFFFALLSQTNLFIKDMETHFGAFLN